MKQQELREKFAKSDIDFVDIETVYFREDTEIAAGTLVEPFVVFGEKVKIGKDCTIKAFSHLEDVIVEDNCIIGPFARIRGGSHIACNAGVGNFVEVVRSTIGSKTAAWHLNYIADAEIEENVELGGGLVISNYDGFNKHKTKIAKNSFVGANTTLISPTNVGEGAMVAAGSVVSGDIEDDALVIERSPLVKKPHGASRYMQRKKS